MEEPRRELGRIVSMAKVESLVYLWDHSPLCVRFGENASVVTTCSWGGIVLQLLCRIKRDSATGVTGANGVIHYFKATYLHNFSNRSKSHSNSCTRGSALERGAFRSGIQSAIQSILLDSVHIQFSKKIKIFMMNLTANGGVCNVLLLHSDNG